MSYFTYQEENIYFTMKGEGPLLVLLPLSTIMNSSGKHKCSRSKYTKYRIATPIKRIQAQSEDEQK